MKLIVQKSQRLAKMRAHSATHILHSCIANFLPDTKQAGSLVDQDYLRFDFVAKNPFSQDQLQQIEQKINQIIFDAIDVNISTQNYQDAITSGAKAFFEDKYGDEVRVVKMGDFSTELCGGTHVSNTSQIGNFVIVSQEAVASGIKRITAYTGPKVFEYICSQREILNAASEKLSASGEKQILEKLEKLVSTNQNLNSQIDSFSSQIINNFYEKNLKDSSLNVSDLQLDFKQILEILKTKNLDKDVIVFKNDGSFGILGKNAKSFAQNNGLKGGGSDNFFQGKDEKILSLIK